MADFYGCEKNPLLITLESPTQRLGMWLLRDVMSPEDFGLVALWEVYDPGFLVLDYHHALCSVIVFEQIVVCFGIFLTSV